MRPIAHAEDPGLSRLDEVPAYELMGVRVNGLTTKKLYALIAEGIQAGDREVIGHHNLHSIYQYHRSSKMRSFYAHARFVFVDGMALIWIGRLLGHPLRREHRMTSVDWLRPMLHEAVQGSWRIMLLGSRPGIAERAATILRNEFPGLEIRGLHGFFDPRPGTDEDEAVLAQVNAWRPDILCVGMGVPRQEHWIEDHLSRIEAKVILNLGGFLDFITGEQPLPPRWLSRLGLEWLVRLVTRPRHTWRRYLWEPWFLMPLLARDLRSRRGR